MRNEITATLITVGLLLAVGSIIYFWEYMDEAMYYVFIAIWYVGMYVSLPAFVIFCIVMFWRKVYFWLEDRNT